MSTATTKKRDPRAVALGSKLQRILDQKQLSRRGFAKLVAPANPEGVRRAINRHLEGDHMPNRLTRRRYELVLEIEEGSLEPDDDEDSERAMPANLVEMLNGFARIAALAARHPELLEEREG